MYKSLIKWRDLTDGHLYQPGDTFPHDGRKVPADRIAVLCNSGNRVGRAVISAVESKVDKSTDKAGETPKRATRSRKKTT